MKPFYKFTVLDPSFQALLRTKPSALSLGKGQWKTLSNVRTAERTIRARFGTVNLGSIVSGGVFRGAHVARFEGVETIFVALYVTLSTKVRIYKSTDGSTWDEITKEFAGINPGDTGIGPYSTTRMDDDGLVWFAVVQDRDIKVTTYPNASYPQDVLVFANQSSDPRVYGRFYGGNSPAALNGAGSLQVSIIEAITAPRTVQGTAVYAELFPTLSGLLIGDYSFITCVANDSADFNAGNNGTSSTDNWVNLTLDATADGGSVENVVIYDNTTTRPLLAGKQLHIGLDSTWTDFLKQVKIEVGDYAGSFTAAATVWDPASTDGNTSAVSNSLGGNLTIYSFDTEAFASQSGHNGIRITFVGPGGTAQTAKVFLVAPGPATATADSTIANPGTTQWAIGLYNSGTRTESPGVVYTKIETPQRINVPFATMVPTSYKDNAIPHSATLFFGYSLPVLNPTQAQIDKGIDSLRIYRKRPQDADFYLVENFELAQYNETPGSPPTSPVWSFVQGSASSVFRQFGLGREAISTTTYCPPFHVPIPRSRCGIGTNDRLFVGTKKTGVPGFMWSEQDHCFRFSEVNTLDENGELVPNSAGALNIQGDQINGFAQVSAAAVGLSPSTAISTNAVYVLGERWVYVTGGKTSGQIFQLSNTGQPGTFSPGSIAVDRERLFYLDRDMQERIVVGGSSDTPPSVNKTDDVLKGIPAAMRRYVWGAYANDRYHLLYTPSGSTRNRNILVWSDVLKDYESIDIAPLTTEAIFPWHDSSDDTVKLIALMQVVGGGGSETLRANVYDGSATTDLGSNIAISGTSYQMHEEEWNGFVVKDIYTVCAPVSATMTYTVDYMPGGQTIFTVSLAGSGDYVRKDSTGPTNTDPGKGESATLSFSASVPGGTPIYNITLRGEERRIEPTRSDA